MADLNPKNSRALAGKYLTFAVSRSRYGAEIQAVQEIIGVTHITPVPRCPTHIKGVINLRGKIIPVIELRTKFGIPSVPYDERTSIVVVQVVCGEQKLQLGVIVDAVLEVIDFAADEIQAPPSYGSSADTKFVVGMGRRDEALTILIDMQRVITEGDALIDSANTEVSSAA